MAYQHKPSMRDSGLARVAVLTTTLGVAGTVATAGVAAGIAAAAPSPKKASADYNGGKPAVQTKNGKIAPPNDRPESSSGDEQTTSGGS